MDMSDERKRERELDSTWHELAAKVGTPARQASDEQLGAAARALGLERFPASYCQYQRLLSAQAEWGLVTEREPLPHILCIFDFDRLAEQRAYILTVLEVPEDGDDDERAASAEARRLIPFGTDTSRSSYCWDPADRGADGELGIVVMNNDTWMPQVTRVAGNLLELLAFYRPWTNDDYD